ncbi:hypothetical protein ACVIM9_007489 [Bradyrhizobium sp. USDA 4520]
MLEPGLVTDLSHDRQERFGRDDHARAEIVELVGELVLLVQRPAGRGNGADLLDAVLRHQVLRTVVHEQRDRLALGDAELLQARRECITRAIELEERDGTAIPDAGRLFRPLAGMAAEHLVKRTFVDVPGRVCIGHWQQALVLIVVRKGANRPSQGLYSDIGALGLLDLALACRTAGRNAAEPANWLRRSLDFD